MLFAESTSTATSTNLFNTVSVAVAILGALCFVAAYFYVTFKKSERDYDKETIRSLKDNNEAVTGERDTWKERALAAEGENKVLQKMVTGAPEVDRLAKKTAEQHLESMKLQNKMIARLDKLIKQKVSK